MYTPFYSNNRSVNRRLRCGNSFDPGVSCKQSGVTLIELMVVIAILAIIAGIALPTFMNNAQESRILECRREVAAIRIAQEEFFLTNNVYASGTLDGPNNIQTLVNNLVGIYIPANVTTSPNANCTYTVVLGGGPAAGAGGPSYTVTATGVNQLAGRGILLNVVGP